MPVLNGHTQRQFKKSAIIASSWLHSTASLISLQDFFLSQQCIFLDSLYSNAFIYTNSKGSKGRK